MTNVPQNEEPLYSNTYEDHILMTEGPDSTPDAVAAEAVGTPAVKTQVLAAATPVKELSPAERLEALKDEKVRLLAQQQNDRPQDDSGFPPFSSNEGIAAGHQAIKIDQEDFDKISARLEQIDAEISELQRVS